MNDAAPIKSGSPYAGKVFYEILPATKPNEVVLAGPLQNIRFVQNADGSAIKPGDYKFVQVFEGKPIVAFRENEILVVDKIIGT